MNVLARAALAAALLLAPAAAAAQGTATAYDSLLARFQAGDTTVATALRMAYTRTPAYDPYDTDATEWRREMFQALGRNDYAKVLEVAQRILGRSYVNANGHFGAGVAYAELGDSAKAEHHFRLARALLASIGEGGGRTRESPMKVIDIAEEYTYLDASGLERRRQALGECNGTPCDVMEVFEPETGKTFSLYFDVSIPKAWFTGRLGGAAQGKPEKPND